MLAQCEGEAISTRTQPTRYGRSRPLRVRYPAYHRVYFAEQVSSSDMSLQENIFSSVIERFSAEQEEIRTAASFAAGTSEVYCRHTTKIAHSIYR